MMMMHNSNDGLVPGPSGLDSKANPHLPDGLIGPRCTTTVSIEGIQCESILDTGSQVTTISETFHSSYLSSLPIQPIQALLEIEGAAGQNVPYIGYVEANLTFSHAVTGAEEKLTALALIVPECHFNSKTPLLVGTNVLLRLYQRAVEQEGSKFMKRSDNYALLLQHVGSCSRSESKTCPVRLHGKGPISIPPKQKVQVVGDVRVGKANPNLSFVLEPHEFSSLPGGLILECALLNISCKAANEIPVVIQNMSDHTVTIQPKHVIGEISAAECVIPLGSPKPYSPPSESHNKEGSETLTFDLDGSLLGDEWKARITERLNSIRDVFATDEKAYGHTTAVKHHIRLQDETPFKERPRPIHPSDRAAVKQHLRELLETGIIRESESPFASPLVLVRKKNGQIRLCVDYRKLNARTVKDAYALPNIEETFSALSGAKWFSVMDLKSGYYQVEMAEQDKHKTAFICPLGFWEFNRMPQGITNAPSTFQRLMEKCVGDLHLNEVLVFLDDLIVFSDTLEEHEGRLMRVLHRLKDYGLKLSPEKCHFFKSSVKYLGHVVDAQGVHTDPDKITALKTWPRPTNREELERFLGFAGYYRRFVEGYSKIAKPLNALKAGCNHPRKRGKTYKKPRPQAPVNSRAPFSDEWTSECERAFKTLVDKLTSAPVLAFANPKLPYVLHTDASGEGLGAALYQEQGGKLKVIAYASRGLSRSEKNYPTHKLEYLALKWAVCEKFHDYLYGSEFTVLTDNNPLTYVFTSAKLDAAGHRWLAALSTYNFSIKYRAGLANKDADGLSRRPHGPPREDEAFRSEKERIESFKKRIQDKECEVISSEVIAAVCQRHCVGVSLDESEHPVLAECLALDPSVLPDSFTHSGQDTIPGLKKEDWYRFQREDPILGKVISFLEAANKPHLKHLSGEPSEVRLLFREWKKLELKDGVLYRKCLDHESEIYQLVLPQQFRDCAFKGIHDEIGHLGAERALSLARARFFWPKMAKDIEKRCQECERCFRRKANPQKAAPMNNILTSYPLELVCMDYLSIEPDSRDTRNILVITDHFTKFAVAIPTRDQKAGTTAKALWENFIAPYGFPSRLHSDQGRDFESRTIKELCSIIGAEKVRTTPYHPQGNPVERFNRTLLSMLGTLEEKDKHHWRDYVKPLVHAYNCTRNDTTGYSPYELMFGRQPALPVDFILGTSPTTASHSTHSEYVHKLRQRLQESYALAANRARKRGEQNKTRFDAKIRAAELVTGDRVLVRNVNIRGKHKLADRWERAIHVVVKRINEGPVYVVKPERGSGPHRTLHRDLLLPCGFLPFDVAPEEESEIKETKRKNLRSRKASDQDMDLSDQEDDMSDEEEDYCSERVIEVMTKPPIIQLAGDELHRQHLPALNPQAAEFTPQVPRVLPREVQLDHPVNVPESVLEVWDSTDANPVMSPDHVVIDIPELGVPISPSRSGEPAPGSTEQAQATNVSPESGQSFDVQPEPVALSESEPDEPRRPARDRHPPRKFTYDELGKPLILALTSFFESLQAILPQSQISPVSIHFGASTHAGTHAV